MAELRALDGDLTDQELLQAVIDFYRQTLLETPKALEYLRRRGLDDPELLERYQIGFADRALARALHSQDSKAGRELRERLSRVGILRETGHGHFNGCVVVPIRDAAGRFIDIRGRKITQELRSGTPRNMRLPGTAENVAMEDQNLARILGQLADRPSVNGDSATADVPQSSVIGSSSPVRGRSPDRTEIPAGSEPKVSDRRTLQEAMKGEINQPRDNFDIEQTESEVTIHVDDRRWRIRGLDKQLSYDRLKVNLMVSRLEAVHVDTFDLYSSRHRSAFIKHAAEELYVDESAVKADLAKILLHLEALQHEQIRLTLKTREPLRGRR